MIFIKKHTFSIKTNDWFVRENSLLKTIIYVLVECLFYTARPPASYFTRTEQGPRGTPKAGSVALPPQRPEKSTEILFILELIFVRTEKWTQKISILYFLSATAPFSYVFVCIVWGPGRATLPGQYWSRPRSARLLIVARRGKKWITPALYSRKGLSVWVGFVW